MPHGVCTKDLPVLLQGARCVYKAPYRKPIKTGELVLRHRTDQLEKNSGGEQEVGDSRERPPLAFLYLPRARLFPRGKM